MRSQYEKDVLTRMTTGFELVELAEAIMRQNLRRWYPNESEEQREERMRTWLLGQKLQPRSSPTTPASNFASSRT